jgi:hypothetical protein
MEAQPSKEFRLLLHEAARLNSRLFTIGCDLGSHTEHRLRYGSVAGGYVQIAMQKYAHAMTIICKKQIGYVKQGENRQRVIAGGSRSF